MKTIAGLRTLINSELDNLAMSIGETTELTAQQIDTVSKGIDDSNETWNENLPKRPN